MIMIQEVVIGLQIKEYHVPKIRQQNKMKKKKEEKNLLVEAFLIANPAFERSWAPLNRECRLLYQHNTQIVIDNTITNFFCMVLNFF